MPELAKQLEIPPSTLSYRISRMEDAGVIAGYYYVYDSKPANILPFLALVKVNDFSARALGRMREFCREHEMVHFLQSSIAEHSYAIYLNALSYEDAARFCSEISSFFSETVLDVQVTPQLRFHKYSAYPFKTLELEN